MKYVLVDITCNPPDIVSDICEDAQEAEDALIRAHAETGRWYLLARFDDSEWAADPPVHPVPDGPYGTEPQPADERAVGDLGDQSPE